MLSVFLPGPLPKAVDGGGVSFQLKDGRSSQQHLFTDGSMTTHSLSHRTTRALSLCLAQPSGKSSSCRQSFIGKAPPDPPQPPVPPDPPPYPKASPQSPLVQTIQPRLALKPTTAPPRLWPSLHKKLTNSPGSISEPPVRVSSNPSQVLDLHKIIYKLCLLEPRLNKSTEPLLCSFLATAALPGDQTTRPPANLNRYGNRALDLVSGWLQEPMVLCLCCGYSKDTSAGEQLPDLSSAVDGMAFPTRDPDYNNQSRSLSTSSSLPWISKEDGPQLLGLILGKQFKTLEPIKIVKTSKPTKPNLKKSVSQLFSTMAAVILSFVFTTSQAPIQAQLVISITERSEDSCKVFPVSTYARNRFVSASSSCTSFNFRFNVLAKTLVTSG